MKGNSKTYLRITIYLRFQGSLNKLPFPLLILIYAAYSNDSEIGSANVGLTYVFHLASERATLFPELDRIAILFPDSEGAPDEL